MSALERHTDDAAPRGGATIGVLALQGDFAEHIASLEACGARGIEVRTLAQLRDVDGLIIPGGESTTIARLLLAFYLMEPLRARIDEGLPVWGTCAGAILLAREVTNLDRPPIAAMDITVERNAFGRQVDSFEADLDVEGLDAPLHAVFIRAPVITRAGQGVEVLARLDDGRIVAAREGRLLATSFHPELTPDHRLHALFARLVEEACAQAGSPPPQPSPTEGGGGRSPESPQPSTAALPEARDIRAAGEGVGRERAR